jgi:hypothetical protein
MISYIGASLPPSTVPQNTEVPPLKPSNFCLLQIRTKRCAHEQNFMVVPSIKATVRPAPSHIIIIIINCKWVDTRWQLSIYILHMHGHYEG